MTSWVYFVIISVIGLTISAGIANALQCSATCDYDQDTRYANCSSRGLNCIPSNYPDADIMDLSSNVIEDISRYDFTGLANVRVLNLDNNQIYGVLDTFIFYELDEIEVVYIRNNFLTEIGSFDFNRPKLSSVFVDNNKIDDDGADEFFSDAIEYLSLDHNEITNFRFTDVFFETLRRISLRFNEMNSFDLTLFEGYSWWKPLRVDIDHNSLTSVDIFCFDPADLDVSLNYNKLNSTSVHVRGFDQITLTLSMENNGLVNLDGLSMRDTDSISLFVSHNRLRNLDMPRSVATSLRYLSIDFNLIEAIQGGTFIDKPDLRGLSAIHNAIYSIAEEAFNSLQSLEYLDLRGNQITDLVFLDNPFQGGALQNVEVGNNKLACNESICNLYLWLLHNPSFHPTTCRYQDGSGSASLPRSLNMTKAGCLIPSTIAPLATNIFMTQSLTQKPQVSSQDPHVHTMSTLTQKPPTAVSHSKLTTNVVSTEKPDCTNLPIGSGSILCHIQSNSVLECDASNHDSIPEDLNNLLSDGILTLRLGNINEKDGSPGISQDVLMITVPSVIAALLIEGVIFLICLKLRRKKDPQNDTKVTYHKRSPEEAQTGSNLTAVDNGGYEDLGPRDVHVYESKSQ